MSASADPAESAHRRPKAPRKRCVMDPSSECGNASGLPNERHEDDTASPLSVWSDSVIDLVSSFGKLNDRPSAVKTGRLGGRGWSRAPRGPPPLTRAAGPAAAPADSPPR